MDFEFHLPFGPAVNTLGSVLEMDTPAHFDRAFYAVITHHSLALQLLQSSTLALFPGTEERRRKSAWYTMFVHAVNRHRILWQQCLYVYVCIVLTS